MIFSGGRRERTWFPLVSVGHFRESKEIGILFFCLLSIRGRIKALFLLVKKGGQRKESCKKKSSLKKRSKKGSREESLEVEERPECLVSVSVEGKRREVVRLATIRPRRKTKRDKEKVG